MKNDFPHISLNLSVNTNLLQIVQDIEKYYPLVNGIENSEHVGYKDLLGKVGDKIDLLIKGQLPFACMQLIEKIKSTFNGLEVITELEAQFPSYSLSVVIREKDTDELKIINSLKIRISLLSKFFTVFHEEKIIHKEIFYPIGTANLVATSLLSSQSSIADRDNNYFIETTKIIESVFVGYSLIGHELLFKRKLNYATPYGVERQDTAQEFSLYSFLFGSDYQSFHFYHVVS